ncbi:hypothetical protein PAHAL_9G326700 [Panicum hallii]|uniref:SKP1 component POZ domain-containing protein n=1 Tax=Panicum hallii TaxID=206008 RepID=A0A2S3IMX9_9POAL|nr:uncharacterized protein LOC112877358 [Panicum hallii]PAN47976.1 hypothetical protein PAHAL_9G326700 [Panicum hallii]
MAASRHDAKQAEQEGTVVLRCFDGVKIPVPTALALRRSELVAAAAGERVVDVPGNVYGPVVARVAAYWEGRAAATGSAAGAAFDAAFLAGLRHDALVDLIHAAHHLGDAALFDLLRSGA